MWKTIKLLPKGLRQKVFPPATTSSTKENNSNDDNVKNHHIPRIPQFYCTENKNNKDIETSTSLSDLVRNHGHHTDCQERIFSGKKCNYGHHFPHNFFEYLGLGFIVAAGLKYGSGYPSKDDENKNKEDGLGTVAKVLFSMASALPRSGIQRLVLPVGCLPSTSTLRATDDETSSSDCESEDGNSSSSESIDENFAHLKDLTSQYTANILNDEAVQLLSENNAREAIQCLTRAIKLGSDKAMFNLGVCYELGQGVEQNLQKAHHFYEKATELGHTQATYNLGISYLQGKGIPLNKEEGLKYIKKASNSGMKEAQTVLGVHYGQAKDYKSAVIYLEKAAMQNHPDAEYFLGICYENGFGVEDDLSKAANYYKKSAAGGNVEACYKLALFYEYGIGDLPEDKERALKFYYKAAKAGHKQAIKMLALEIHSKSRSIKTSLEKMNNMRSVSSLPNLPSLNWSNNTKQL